MDLTSFLHPLSNNIGCWGQHNISSPFSKNNIKIKDKLEKEISVLRYHIYLNENIRPFNHLLGNVNYVGLLQAFHLSVTRNFAGRVNL